MYVSYYCYIGLLHAQQISEHSTLYCRFKSPHYQKVKQRFDELVICMEPV